MPTQSECVTYNIPVECSLLVLKKMYMYEVPDKFGTNFGQISSDFTSVMFEIGNTLYKNKNEP